MTSQINDINSVEAKFYKALGNGAAALGYAVEMIESVVQSRDTTVLTRAIDRAASKGDDKAVASLKLMIRNVWEGAKMTKSKTTGQTSIKIKGIDASVWALSTCQQLVADGVSLRGTLLSKAFATEAEQKAFDVTKWAERSLKAHPEDLEAMIAALQALRK